VGLWGEGLYWEGDGARLYLGDCRTILDSGTAPPDKRTVTCRIATPGVSGT